MAWLVQPGPPECQVAVHAAHHDLQSVQGGLSGGQCGQPLPSALLLVLLHHSAFKPLTSEKPGLTDKAESK